MRLEVVDRQRFQHVLVVAQIVLTLSAQAAAAAPERWRAWGEPKFAGDPRQDRPLLVAIGHPTSHEWKPQDHPAFVPVILDRDIHPHIAAAYTRFAALAGATDDPLHVILTPHLEPVAAIGSASPESVKAFLDDVASRWASDREALVAEAGLMLRRFLLTEPPEGGDAPELEMLLANGDETSRKKTIDSLRAFVRTARYDQIGGGFFRATRDAEGRMPNFDKSLVDQARYAIALTHAWQVTRDPQFADVARATLDFVLSELQDRSGVFHAGVHADSLVPRGGPQLVEGGHYIWQTEEIRHLLGPKLGDIFVFHYGLSDERNVPASYDSRGHFRGRNVPFVAHTGEETRARFGLSEQELSEALRSGRQKLLDVRSKRPDPAWHPLVITAYNGLAISALARAGVAFDEPRYAEAAVRAARALLQRNHDATGKKLTRMQGVAALPADYAHLIRGLLDAYEASFDVSLIARAIALQQQQDRVGSAAGVPDPVAALAAGDTHAATVGKMNLARLAAITGNESWSARAGDGSFPAHRQVIIAGERWRDDTKTMLRAVQEPFDPRRMVFLIDNKRTRAQLATWMPYVNDILPVEKEAVGTVCEERTCRTPTADAARLRAWVD